MRVDKIQRLSPAGFADFRQLRRVGRVPSVRFYPLVDKIQHLSPAGLADFRQLRRVGRVSNVRFYPLVPSAVVVVTKDAKVRAGEGMLRLGGARKRATGSDNVSPLMRDFAAGMTDLRLSSCDHDPSVAGQRTGDLSLLAHASVTAP
jgi:hypothetical protein